MKFWNSFFKKSKRIAFIDGDQPIPGLVAAYKKYLGGTGIETHFIRAINGGGNPPHEVKQFPEEVNKIYLRDYTAGKEVVDKFIGAYIQKSLAEGYSEIIVVSSDYDFIEIFKLSLELNPNVKNVNFKIIVPKARGRLVEAESVANIEIVKL